MHVTDGFESLVYVLPLTLILALYFRRRMAYHARSQAILEESVAAGLTEPASLHPVIDEGRCVGCAACVKACPEGDVLGIIDGRGALVSPADCIGHGACKTACPTDAITLVFGTERRGVEIPAVKETFETNVPGIFIAGELGGMGLIRNAIEQGRQAMSSIRRLPRSNGSDGRLDVVIVGAGPAGFSATLGAAEAGLRFVTLEQESFGGTVAHYPRGKIVMTAPARLPIVGRIKLRETTKEALLELWGRIREETGVSIRYGERMESIVRTEAGFEVRSSKETYRTRTVLLALGRRGTPRKLGVPGEDLSKVVYRLADPAQYRGQRVLVVGGGDSALEAAVALATEGNAQVTLACRDGAFPRAKPKNRRRVAEVSATSRLTILSGTTVTRISPSSVLLQSGDQTIEIDNDAVIVCAGGVLPTPILKDLGVAIDTKYGTP